MRAKNKLTAISIRAAPAGKLLDGGGLIFVKDDTGGKWIYRYTFAGKRREMGLGSGQAVTLAEARKARDKWATELLAGHDPISARERIRQAERDDMARTDPVFADVAQQVFAAMKATLRGDGERGRWFSPLRLHVIPKLGRKPISQITARDIADALRSIWKAKHPTAEKALQRTRIVFRQAKLMTMDCDPFTVDQAKHLLGQHHAESVGIVATPWQAIPALFAKLDRPESSYQALRFMILTCVRAESARGALFSEIDGDVWTVPADRIKGRQGRVAAFRVPLSPQAQAIVAAMRAVAVDGRIFPGYRSTPISQNALLKTMNAVGELGRPHGFRTSFRTYCQDTKACDWDVAETILGHRIGGKTERAYARSDMIDQRRAAMAVWGDFVAG